MKNTFFQISLLVLIAQPLVAQKHDNVWITGGDYGVVGQGKYKIDFGTVPISIDDFSSQGDFFFTTTQMSDSNGDLLFYSNGCAIYTSDDNVMDGGDSLNYDEEGWKSYCNLPQTLPKYIIPNGAFALPYPDRGGFYVLLHSRGIQYIDAALYSVIDMSANNGKGRVVSKNQVLNDGGKVSTMTACRHANGRDWWVMFFKLDAPDYYRYLLTPEGLQGPWVQTVPDRPVPAQARDPHSNFFSPTGDKYVDIASKRGINYYNFDRCTGLLSNPVFTDFATNTDPFLPWYVISGAFSPNGRYLYVADNRYGPQAKLDCRLVQYDTERQEWWLHGDTVGVSDGMMFGNIVSAFSAMQLAPDGRILINANDIPYLHYIEQPNMPGAACGFRQRGIDLPVNGDAYLPHFPNYRLYDVPGSGCDTLGIDGPVVGSGEPQGAVAGRLRVYPNPVRDIATVVTNGRPGWLLVHDVLGRLVLRQQSNGLAHDLDLSALLDGVYVVSFQSRDDRHLNTTVVIQH